MPKKYLVETDQGKFEVEVEDGVPEQPVAAPSPVAPAAPPSDSGALGMASVRPIGRIVGRTVEGVATNPNLWKTGKLAGEILGGGLGMVKAGPLGAAGGMWVGGRAGWRLANAAQRMAAPVATAVQTAAPYAQALNTLSGAEGLGGLAQMAEPTRQDIGFLGIGPSVDVPGASPAILNRLASYLRGQLIHR